MNGLLSFWMAKKLQLIYVPIFYVDNTVLGVTTEQLNRIKREREKKTGYYLCMELSKDGTAK